MSVDGHPPDLEFDHILRVDLDGLRYRSSLISQGLRGRGDAARAGASKADPVA
jgi:hypothetical protein